MTPSPTVTWRWTPRWAASSTAKGDAQRPVPGRFPPGQLPFVTPFLVAVHTVLDDLDKPGSDAPTATDIAALMRSAAEQGSDTQCGAGAARLRRLARRLPAKAQSLDQLSDILNTLDQPEPAR